MSAPPVKCVRRVPKTDERDGGRPHVRAARRGESGACSRADIVRGPTEPVINDTPPPHAQRRYGTRRRVAGWVAENARGRVCVRSEQKRGAWCVVRGAGRTGMVTPSQLRPPRGHPRRRADRCPERTARAALSVPTVPTTPSIWRCESAPRACSRASSALVTASVTLPLLSLISLQTLGTGRPQVGKGRSPSGGVWLASGCGAIGRRTSAGRVPSPAVDTRRT